MKSEKKVNMKYTNWFKMKTFWIASFQQSILYGRFWLFQTFFLILTKVSFRAV